MSLVINRYIVFIIILSLVLPIVSTTVGVLVYGLSIFQAWKMSFLTFAVGVRLLIAGMHQIANPDFTLQHIFNIKEIKARILVQEIGISNLILGGTALLHCFFPSSETLIVIENCKE